MESTIIPWSAPSNAPAVSVVFGRTFAFSPEGRCDDTGPYSLREDYAFYTDIPRGTGYIQPSILERDVDLWPWRGFTDLVVQGIARPPTPRASMQVVLACQGSTVSFGHTLAVSGDRVVERGRHGLQLSAPERFEAMPLRHDKAYGGTDESVRKRDSNRLEDRMIHDLVGSKEDRENSDFSYPRNPAGKGYVLDSEFAEGTHWPNIEFPDDPLEIEKLVASQDAWGERPYPASFDWFPHAWFPRVAFFGEFPPTASGRVPTKEVDMGLCPANLREMPILARPKHPFAQGAHPRLWRHRLLGDERIRVDGIGFDGAPLLVQLPRLSPRVRLRMLDGAIHELATELDLVLVEGETRHVTLLWRAHALVGDLPLPPGWRERMPYTIEW
jgi:hypothetical protein